jgi:hypothetical protein
VTASAAESTSLADSRDVMAEQDFPGCPIWWDILITFTTAAILCCGGVGLLLADTGHYSASVALPIGAVLAVAATALAWPRATERSPRRQQGTVAPAVAMGIVAVIQMVWNGVDITRHVAANRDPGVYLLTGKWLSEHKSLIIPGRAVWGDKGSHLFSLTTAGIYQMHNGTLQFQFAHMMAVLLAEADTVGGDRLMFRVPAVLGAIGLCTIYAVGVRLVRRPWLVVAALTGLAISLPELNVTRDTFSEPSTQILLWGGILLILRAYRTRRPALAVIAGLAVGGTLMTHIDSVIYLVPLLPLAVLGWLTARDREDRRSLVPVIGTGLLGVIPTAVLGTFDVQRRAGQYYDDLSSQMHSLYKLLAASVVLAMVIIVAWTLLPRVAGRVSSFAGTNRGLLAKIGGWIVGIGLLAAWALRPAKVLDGNTGAASDIGNLQARLGLPAQPYRTYAEQTLRWFEWYIGPIALALAIIGLVLLVVWAIRSGSVTAIVLLTMVGGITALYLWNPSITPDQIWATRRYATGAFPLFALAAALALDVGAGALARLTTGRVWPRQVAAVGAAGLIAFPLGTVAPVRNFHSQAGWLLEVEHACKEIGPNAAVVFPPADYDGVTLSMAFQDWCHYDTAMLDGPESEASLEAAAARFGQEGKSLWVVAYGSTAITSTVHGLKPEFLGEAVSTEELAQTLEGPPEHYSVAELSIYAARVP